MCNSFYSCVFNLPSSPHSSRFWEGLEIINTIVLFCFSSEDDSSVFATNSLQRRKKGLALTGLNPGATHPRGKSGPLIGPPQNFRQISSIIDVDILPEAYRRVRLHKHGTNKPLGFYIRDGVSMRVTAQGVEKVRTAPLFCCCSWEASGR